MNKMTIKKFMDIKERGIRYKKEFQILERVK